MTKEDFAKVANNAINAAQKVIYDAGIRDRMVAELGFARTEDIKGGAKTFAIETVHRCPCWDCVNTNGGSCVCCGPACNC